MNWNHDISAAPRGKMVPYTRKGKDGPVQAEQYRKEYILAVDAHGMVYQSYWIPPRYTQSGGLLEGNRWSGFNPGVDPIAWAPWPEYPNMQRNGADELLGGFPVAAAETNAEETGVLASTRQGTSVECGTGQGMTAGETATQFYLEDVGGGA